MECKWKHSRLEVDPAHLKNLMSNYNSSVTTARKKYFSNIIAESHHNPRILFRTIEHVVGSKNN